MICPKCNNDKKPTDFHWKNRTKGIRRKDTCKQCWKIYQKKWYRENKSDCLARNIEHKKLTREARRKLKEVPCADCKVQYPHYVMQHDHLRNKKYNVASITNISTLLKEVAKCEVVCANCHAERTYQRKVNAGLA